MAAQILSGQGFNEVFNLTGGIKAWNGLKAAGPMEQGMALINGEETPSEILMIAYGLEEGLRSFYAQMASQSEDRTINELFTKLSNLEVAHKNRLFRLYSEKSFSLLHASLLLSFLNNKTQ